MALLMMDATFEMAPTILLRKQVEIDFSHGLRAGLLTLAKSLIVDNVAANDSMVCM